MLDTGSRMLSRWEVKDKESLAFLSYCTVGDEAGKKRLWCLRPQQCCQVGSLVEPIDILAPLASLCCYHGKCTKQNIQ